MTPTPLQYLPTCLLVSDTAIPFVSGGNRGWVFTADIQDEGVEPS